jgi:hypothetical protein
MAGQVLVAHGPAHAARGTCEVAVAVGDGRDLVAQGTRKRFAAIQRFEAGKFLGTRFDAVGQLQQQARALHRRGLAPGVERAVGGRHRLVHLIDRRFAKRDQHLAGRRIEHLFGLAFAGEEGAVDQQFGGQCDVGHGGLLQREVGSSARVSR